MTRKIIAVLVLAAITSCRRGSSNELRPLPTEPYEAKARHVLFIGNSLTYYNLMPQLFEAVAKSKGIEVQTRGVVRGGATLKWHWTNGEAQKVLAEGKFDVVVIQPMSSEILTNESETREYASFFTNAARTRGADVVLYAPWPPKALLDRKDEFTKRYRALAETLNAPLAPAFAAFEAVRDSGTELYNSSALHPNLAGSYVAALVLFATIFDRDPAGATHTFALKPPDASEDFAALSREHIDDAEAAALQKAAWNAVKSEPLAQQHPLAVH